jgi:ribose transport system permease protein
MTGQVGAAPGGTPWLTMDAWRGLFRDRPLVPLTGLLVVLVAIMELVQPGTVNPAWVGVAIRAAVPLAILGACQTLTMLTGGIDLSIGMIASMAAFIMATQTPLQGPVVAIVLALAACALVGIANGIGVGIFKVHPLIMTLGMTLVILGLLTVYQLMVVQTGTEIPDFVLWLSSETTFEILPNNLLVFVPLAVVIIAGLRYSGFGRLLFAVGDNPVAARLSGVRVWQVLVALYVLSALLAGLAGFLIAGLVQTASVSLVAESVLPAVAAAVIGGTSILGGRGGYSGTIVGALILTVVGSLLVALQMPEAVRQILFGMIIVVVAAAYTRVTGES